jgi:hypothetical protein
MAGSEILGFAKQKMVVILREAKNLFLFGASLARRKKQVLRFTQDDNSFLQLTITRGRLGIRHMRP